MRTLTLLCLMTACWLAAGSRPLGGETDKGKEESRIAALIQQLGDDAFARREEASKQLEALGDHLGIVRVGEETVLDQERRARVRVVQAHTTS